MIENYIGVSRGVYLGKSLEAESYVGSGKKTFPHQQMEDISPKKINGATVTSDRLNEKQGIGLARRGLIARLWIRWWRHYKRYWCCYGLAGVIFLAIFLPVFFLVIIPAAANALVRHATLPIASAGIWAPNPDNITFSLTAHLKVPKPFAVRLEPFNLSLYRKSTGVTFVQVTLPEYRLKGDATITIVNQTVQIQNMTEFVGFLHDAVYQENFTMSTKGSTTAWLGKLKARINLNKDVQMNGLNELSGFSITSAEALLPPQNGANIAGTLDLPNASVVSFALGNETLNLKVGNLNIGTGTIYNVVLVPGNNTCSFTGYLDIPTLLKNIEPIIVSEAPSLIQGNLQLAASGNSTIYDGHHVTYYEEILNNLTLTGSVPVIQLLEGTLGSLLNSSSGTLASILSNLNTSTLLPALSGLKNITRIAA